MEIVKIMLAVGIIAGLAVLSAKAQEGCNGPVFVPGFTTGTCACANTIPIGSGNCSSGTVTVRNDYTRCGGSGFTYCHEMNDTVGRASMPCVQTMNLPELTRLEMLYRDCLVDCDRHNVVPYVPCSSCYEPRFCDWNSCNTDTTGGSPITALVLYELGESPCGMAKLQKYPSPSVIELARVILREQE